MQIESKTCQARLSNYAKMQLWLCKITNKKRKDKEKGRKTCVLLPDKNIIPLKQVTMGTCINKNQFQRTLSLFRYVGMVNLFYE